MKRLRNHSFFSGIDFSEEDFGKALGFVNAVKIRLQQQPKNYHTFATVLKYTVNGGTGGADIEAVKKRMRSILDGHSDLITGFNSFLPNQVNQNRHNHQGPDAVIQAFQGAIDFTNNVKMQGDCLFEGFLRLMASYKSGLSRSVAVAAEVRQLFLGHQDLQDQFLRLLLEPEPEKKDKGRKFQKIAKEEYGVEVNGKELQNVYQRGVEFFRKVKENMSCGSETYMEFYNYAKQKMENSELEDQEIASVEQKYPDLMGEFKILLNNWMDIGEEDRGQDDQDLDQSRERIVDRDKFEWDDMRHELDVLLHWFSSAIKYVEGLLEGKEEGEMGKMKKIHFTRCVERMYDDYGLDVVDIVENDPKTALPTILVRLVQKREEFVDYRSYFDECWANFKRHRH